MKRTVNYNDPDKKLGKKEYEYDDEIPCIICGEPVVSASMGGTVICPWCDTGHCRYCGITTMVIREEIDGGVSKRELLAHMEKHRKEEPDFNSKLLRNSREMQEKWRKNG